MKKNSSAPERAKHTKLPFPDGKDRAKAGITAPQEDYDPYRLKREAVEALVNADSENAPPVPREELRKYHVSTKPRLPVWLRAVLIKAWMAGVICYFFVWGLSSFAIHQWDLMLVLGLVLGGLTHLITNNIFRFIEKTPGAYNPWMMFPKDKLWFLPLNLLYSLVLVLCVAGTYGALNTFLTRDGGAVLGVEPILFGLLTVLWDLLFLGFKRLGLRILRDARQSTPRNHPE